MTAPGLAEALGLAAAPTFAGMALLTGVAGDGAAAVLCAPAHGSALGGMVTMYLLMSVFHLPPWLRRIRSQGSQGRPDRTKLRPSPTRPDLQPCLPTSQPSSPTSTTGATPMSRA